MSAEIEVRNANVRDLAAVLHVARATWSNTYRNIIPEDVQDRFLECAYSEESLMSRMAADTFLVAVRNGEVVGFADFSPLVFTDFRPVLGETGEAELAAIYVLPDFQRQGIGTRLLEAGLTKMPSASKIHVGVERENATGRRFYESKGFAETEERIERIFDHNLHTLRMTLEITEETLPPIPR